MQSVIHFLYPPRCLSCGTETTEDFGLCGSCWADTPFVSGLVCDSCGTPLPGDNPDEIAHCDACINSPMPWQRGRAALVYEGNARNMILALKHGDRLDMVRAMAGWMVQKARALPLDNVIVAPVPLHRWRLLRRRYNQAAVLALEIAKRGDLPCCPDLVQRRRPTSGQGGLGRIARFRRQKEAFCVPENRRLRLQGKRVLMVDDVMTTGATLAACTEACLAAGAKEVNILVLARVASDP